jgi:hypothetical protein
VFGAIDYPVAWLCRTILFEKSTLRILSMTIGGEEHGEMAARLHDLVQGLLVRHAEKHADALLGSSANTTKRAFGAVAATAAEKILAVDNLAREMRLRLGAN